LLWGSAYDINPTSHHTQYNYGYELSIKQRYEEANKRPPRRLPSDCIAPFLQIASFVNTLYGALPLWKQSSVIEKLSVDGKNT
jgi:hypothetical protein